MAAKKDKAEVTPSAVVKQDCRVYWQSHLLELKAGQEIEGPLAIFLLDTGAPVEVKNNGAGGRSE